MVTSWSACFHPELRIPVLSPRKAARQGIFNAASSVGNGPRSRAALRSRAFIGSPITEPDAIGVAVTDGTVTLTGSVRTYAEKLAAMRTAEGVYRVKAVASELKVKLADGPRDDSDIARAIAHVLENNVQVPEGKVHARVACTGNPFRGR
jgi:osmotically-inducible protein OsmY